MTHSAVAAVIHLDISDLAGFTTYGASGTAGNGTIFVSPVYHFNPGDSLDFGTATLFPDPPDGRQPCGAMCLGIMPTFTPFVLSGGIGGFSPADDIGPFNDFLFGVFPGFVQCAPNNGPCPTTTVDLQFTLGPTEDGIQLVFQAGNLVIAPPVPEPSTWALLLIGFAGIGFAVHRRSRRRGYLRDQPQQCAA
jgi:hypothetical protein